KYRRNVDALENVIPKDKTPSEISASIGAAFVPADLYEQFVKHISGGSATANYVKATGQWLLAFNAGTDPALNTGRFGTSDLSAQALFELTMFGRGAVVKQTLRNPDGSTITILLEKETEAAREKQNAIKAEWQKWLWQDPARSDRLASIYNDKMNRIVERTFDGSHMGFPGMNPALTLLSHQKNGVWRGLQSFQVLYDHAVGAGKTFAMATLAMEMRRLGLSRKPLFVVPNHLTLQWRSEFTRLYPGSNILAAEPSDFSKDNRERLFAKIITGDWDAVVIGHSSLKKIGLPEKTEIAVLQEQVDEIAEAIEDMKRVRGDRRITADMERIRKNLETKMKEKLAALGKRSKMVTFDELGIDAMFIDEMHEFKNLAYNTTMDRNPGMGNPTGSGKAFDMFVKVRWLFDTFGDKTPFVTATGTPVSNSLVEMFNMQRYMQYPTLKRNGLHVFDAWAKQFGSVENVYEVAPSGAGYRQSTRFAKFTNLPGLMSLYNSFADTITLDDLKAQEEAQGKRFPVPKMVGGRPVLVVAERSPAVAALMGVPKATTDEDGNIQFGADLGAEIQIVQDEKAGKWTAKVGNAHLGQFATAEDARLKVVEHAMTPRVSADPNSILGRFANLRQLTRDTKGKVNALSLTSEANKAGLDYRLIDPAAPDFPGSKINLAVDNMLRIYTQWQADRGVQLVFCDMSIPLSARVSYSSKSRRLYVRDAAGGITMEHGTLHALTGHEDLPYFVIQRGKKEAKRFDVHDAASGLLLQADSRSKKDAIEAASALLNDEAQRQTWINAREATGEIEPSDIDEYNNEHEVDTENPALFFTREDVAGMAGSAKFSVYDDIKAKLMAKGVPAREIAFIHDYSTPTAKDKLFRAVNAGEVRFLLGSTPKMGAGTNVQKRLVGLHHIDAPWRPSDLEQREGRIIRRDNELYARDPDTFEVFIGRYATAQTYDTRRWQILEHKARGIEQLRNYDGTINEIDDIGGEAATAADMKAAASGDPLILEETKLRNDVRRLEQLQAGHADEVLAMTRKARDAQEHADTKGPATVRNIKDILATAAKHPVGKDGFSPISVWGGKPLADKEAAHKALASIFENVRSHMVNTGHLEYRGLPFALEYNAGGYVTLRTPTGTGGTWDMLDPFSPSGLVQRLKNYIDRLPAMQAETQARIEKSKKEA
ncbi:MAG: DEAD/DEAH box helicase family protein, partial [Stenotrophomonas sp.]